VLYLCLFIEMKHGERRIKPCEQDMEWNGSRSNMYMTFGIMRYGMHLSHARYCRLIVSRMYHKGQMYDELSSFKSRPILSFCRPRAESFLENHNKNVKKDENKWGPIAKKQNGGRSEESRYLPKKHRYQLVVTLHFVLCHGCNI
jgi:hypothetical protein